MNNEPNRRRRPVVRTLVVCSVVAAGCSVGSDEREPRPVVFIHQPSADEAVIHASGSAPSGVLEAVGMDAGGDGGADGGAGCNTTKSPAEERCLIDERYGMFVSPMGSDLTGRGTREHPYRSFVVARAWAGGRSIYACATGGAFDDRVVIDTPAASRFYGGFTCDTWQYRVALRTKVAPVAVGVALRIASVQNVLFEDFDFVAKDGVTPSDNSVGVEVLNSSGIRLNRVTVRAGKGADGLAGITDPTPATPGLPGKNGQPSCTADPPGGGFLGAAGGKGCFGNGGSGGVGGQFTSGGAGMPTAPCNSVLPNPTNGAGCGGAGAYISSGPFGTMYPGPGHSGGPTLTKEGEPGANASDANGATGTGNLSAAGMWTGTTGIDGNTGVAGGSGGGGGGGATNNGCGFGSTGNKGGGGGGGGGGGCGGRGGKGGLAGGASIAVVSVRSELAIDDSLLLSSSGGKGGDGAPGLVGAAGAPGGTASGFGLSGGGPGGYGASGGHGGRGGGGSGGHSLGVAYLDVAPVVADTTKIARVTGAKGGAGGKGANATLDGLEGLVDGPLGAWGTADTKAPTGGNATSITDVSCSTLSVQHASAVKNDPVVNPAESITYQLCQSINAGDCAECAGANAGNCFDSHIVSTQRGPSTYFRVTSLKPGTQYYFAVRPVDKFTNRGLVGPTLLRITETTVDTLEPVFPPGAYATASVVSGDAHKLQVSWSGAATDDCTPSTDLQYQACIGALCSPTVAGSAPYAVIDGLTSNTYYAVELRVTDGYGKISTPLTATRTTAVSYADQLLAYVNANGCSSTSSCHVASTNAALTGAAAFRGAASTCIAGGLISDYPGATCGTLNCTTHAGKLSMGKSDIAFGTFCSQLYSWSVQGKPN